MCLEHKAENDLVLLLQLFFFLAVLKRWHAHSACSEWYIITHTCACCKWTTTWNHFLLLQVDHHHYQNYHNNYRKNQTCSAKGTHRWSGRLRRVVGTEAVPPATGFLLPPSTALQVSSAAVLGDGVSGVLLGTMSAKPLLLSGFSCLIDLRRMIRFPAPWPVEDKRITHQHPTFIRPSERIPGTYQHWLR